MEYPWATLPPNKEIDPWMKDMEHLSLRARRHVFLNLKPPISLFLYKYFSADAKYSRQNLHDVIVSSVLRLSSPISFNDPFEMAAHFVMTASDEEKLKRFELLVREQAPYLGWRAIQARVKNLMEATEESLTPIWQKSLRSIRNSAGIYCFAGNAKNRLMWGHYASNHTGLCLQFERAQDLTVLPHAISLDYTPNLPTLNWIIGFKDEIFKMLASKDSCWAYEQESRIIIFNQAGRYLQFAPRALRRLIFGCRSEPSFIEYVKSLLAERKMKGLPPIEIFKAKEHPSKYRLVVTSASAG